MVKTLAIQLLWNADGLYGGFIVMVAGSVSNDLLLLMHVNGLALPRSATRPLSFVARLVRLAIVVLWLR
jgi:hypothetical protein